MAAMRYVPPEHTGAQCCCSSAALQSTAVNAWLGYLPPAKTGGHSLKQQTVHYSDAPEPTGALVCPTLPPNPSCCCRASI
jgi:hypothetical protein